MTRAALAGARPAGPCCPAAPRRGHGIAQSPSASFYAGPTSSGQPCTQLREYAVDERGNVLDRSRNVTGEVQPGDRVQVRNLRTDPYPHRYEATILRTGQTGYIDQARLRYIGTVCS
jgi:hypothetical protein